MPDSTTQVIDREFSFSDRDFERVRKLIYAKAGISLNDGKHAMVYSRLSRRLRETGHQSFDSYLQWLENNAGPRQPGVAGIHELPDHESDGLLFEKNTISTPWPNT